MDMKTCATIATVGIFTISLMLCGCDKGPSTTGAGTASGNPAVSASFETPEAAFAAFQSAAKAEDPGKLMECMSPKSQNEFAFAMVMMSGFLPMKYMDDEAKAEALGKEVQAILDKHGLSEDKMKEMDPGAEPDLNKFFAPVKDRGALVADVYAIIAREGPDTPLKMIAGMTMTDVKVEGDKATGKVVVDEKENDIEFVKVGGSWLVEMPGPGGPGPGQP